jgi:hypothetical protein
VMRESTLSQGMSPNRQYRPGQLAGGGARFVVTAQAINYPIVNREALYEDGKHTRALPGQVVRSQRRN